MRKCQESTYVQHEIRILLTCWPKPNTKVGNSTLRERKLLFLAFEIIFLNVSGLDYIFGENVTRKKLFRIKFSIRTL